VIWYAYKSIFFDFGVQMGQCCQQPFDLGQMCPQNTKQTVFFRQRKKEKRIIIIITIRMAIKKAHKK